MNGKIVALIAIVLAVASISGVLALSSSGTLGSLSTTNSNTNPTTTTTTSTTYTETYFVQNSNGNTVLSGNFNTTQKITSIQNESYQSGTLNVWFGTANGSTVTQAFAVTLTSGQQYVLKADGSYGLLSASFTA